MPIRILVRGKESNRPKVCVYEQIATAADQLIVSDGQTQRDESEKLASAAELLIEAGRLIAEIVEEYSSY